MPSPDFWPVVATTLPVLALAIVLEARWVIGRASRKELPLSAARVLLFAYGFNIIAMCIAEQVAFGILAGGSRDTEHWRSLGASAATLGFTTLVFSPGLSILLASFSGLFAIVRTGKSYYRYYKRLLWLRRERRRQVRSLQEVVAQHETMALTYIEALDYWDEHREFTKRRAAKEDASPELLSALEQWEAFVDPTNPRAQFILEMSGAIEAGYALLDHIDHWHGELKRDRTEVIEKLRELRADYYFRSWTYSVVDQMTDKRD